ncbi:hypothetical protein ATANTOWER_010601 [Ataeniobius toweri]|uniref:Uncharacterized protein n=1 Tax=Ataeniobius toweri TaxID=208326 RepID=A0ABU7AFS2_9TELE|nr:hypothetical protein [Ataeniobius toweri]
MLLPSSCLRFGPPQTQTVTLRTSQENQADKANELKKWVRQQEEDLRKRYGEVVELLPSPLLLQVMEEAGVRQLMPVFPVFIPGRIRSSLPPTASVTSSSRRHRHRRKPFSSPTATAASPEPFMLAAVSAKLSTPTAALPEPSKSPTDSGEFLAGFGSRPG